MFYLAQITYQSYLPDTEKMKVYNFLCKFTYMLVKNMRHKIKNTTVKSVIKPNNVVTVN